VGRPLAKLLRAGVAARAGDRRAAIHHLADAAAGCDAAGMASTPPPPAAAAASSAPSPTAPAGATSADAWLSGQDVADIPRLLATLVPGFADAPVAAAPASPLSPAD
jgi:hypothetical protein